MVVGSALEQSREDFIWFIRWPLIRGPRGQCGFVHIAFSSLSYLPALFGPT